jgi:chromate reductase
MKSKQLKKILILNGSPSGKKGNSAKWVDLILVHLSKKSEVEVVHLKDSSYGSVLKKKIEKADGYIFVTGTYWDSWGSPLQKLLEDITELEASPKLMGKPAAVFVLMHSVGGKGVLSRLQGVLSTLGLLIPPMSGMVYSLVSDEALKRKSSFAEDFWQKDDAKLILENFLIACDLKVPWKVWPVDKADPKRNWL